MIVFEDLAPACIKNHLIIAMALSVLFSWHPQIWKILLQSFFCESITFLKGAYASSTQKLG